jgi:putative NADPH-quinone reductase
MSKRILIIQGHPDASQTHLCHALACSYSTGAVVTMGMPAFIYRWYFLAHSLKSLEHNLLGIVGIAPVNETLFGLTGNMKAN